MRKQEYDMLSKTQFCVLRGSLTRLLRQLSEINIIDLSRVTGIPVRQIDDMEAGIIDLPRMHTQEKVMSYLLERLQRRRTRQEEETNKRQE